MRREVMVSDFRWEPTDANMWNLTMDENSDTNNGPKRGNEVQNNHPLHPLIIPGIFVIIGAIITGIIGPIVIERIKATPIPTPAPKLCEGTNLIEWDETADHSGEILTVFGPVVDTTYSSSADGRPTFLNIGKEFPDPERFTVVIWGDDRPKFPDSPEQFYRGKEICVRGLISEFQGSMQIEIDDPSQIEIK
jgi:hypothetical protein